MIGEKENVISWHFLTVGRADSSVGITSDAGAVASVVGDVVDGLVPDVGRGAVVANQEVLVVVLKTSVLELSPAASANKEGEIT